MFRYQAQSDIADHGYRTECPPMLVTTKSNQLQELREPLFHYLEDQEVLLLYLNKTEANATPSGK
jgi:hypothetical protein